MKKTICIILTFAIFFECKAQAVIEEKDWNTILENGQKVLVWTRTEKTSQFKGGMQKWKEFLDSNLNKEKIIASYKRKRKSREVTAFVNFIVMKDGSIEKIRIQTKDPYTKELITKEFEDEIIRTIKLSPKWIPPSQNGRIVHCWRTEDIKVIVPAK